MSTDRPNILYIMSDDHASMAMSCYGSYRNHTPNMDRIAAEGIRLDNCFCTNSICTPSRASILTGQYAHVNGAITFNPPSPSSVTFPQLLRDSGYFTAMIGKWHLGCEPTGFDRWAVLPGQGKYHDPDFVDQGVRKTIEGYVTDIITDLTIETLENRPKDRPFCVLCHHKAPHDMWLSDEKHSSLFEGETLPEPPSLFDDYHGKARAVLESTQVIGSADPGHTVFPDETGHITDPVERRRAQYQEYMKRYLRCVASIDDNVGRLLDYMDSAKLTDDTLVIYTSDQGFFLGEHGWYDKRFMYEESLRMPFVARLPGRIDPGSIDDHIILNTDFAATFLDYAGIETAPGMQSESFRSILEGDDPADWRETMYYRYYKSHFNTPSNWGVRTKRHKLICYHESGEYELYDMIEDPAEMTNLYADPGYAGIREHLEAELLRLREELGDHEGGTEGEERCLRLLNEPKHPLFRI